METPVLSIGVININTGMNAHNWNIYENSPEHSELYYVGGFLIFGAKGSLKEGDVITLIGNDSRRRLKPPTTVERVIPNSREELLKTLLELGYDYYPKRAFQKSKFKRKLSTSYVLK